MYIEMHMYDARRQDIDSQRQYVVLVKPFILIIRYGGRISIGIIKNNFSFMSFNSKQNRLRDGANNISFAT